MKQKTKSSWLPVYVLTGAGSALLLLEGVIPFTATQLHLILMMTLLAMFWIMYQIVQANHFRINATRSEGRLRRQPVAIRIETYHPRS